MVSLNPAEKLAVLTVLFAVLNTADWATTMYGLPRGAVEANPLVRDGLNSLALIATVKLVGFPLLFALMYGTVFLVGIRTKQASVTKIVLKMAVVVNIIYLIIIINNLVVNLLV